MSRNQKKTLLLCTVCRDPGKAIYTARSSQLCEDCDQAQRVKCKGCGASGFPPNTMIESNGWHSQCFQAFQPAASECQNGAPPAPIGAGMKPIDSGVQGHMYTALSPAQEHGLQEVLSSHASHGGLAAATGPQFLPVRVPSRIADYVSDGAYPLQPSSLPVSTPDALVLEPDVPPTRPFTSFTLEHVLLRASAMGLVRDRQYRFKTLPRCISGRDLVEFLLWTRQARDRPSAFAVGRALLAAGLIAPVGTPPLPAPQGPGLFIHSDQSEAFGSDKGASSSTTPGLSSSQQQHVFSDREGSVYTVTMRRRRSPLDSVLAESALQTGATATNGKSSIDTAMSYIFGIQASRPTFVSSTTGDIREAGQVSSTQDIGGRREDGRATMVYEASGNNHDEGAMLQRQGSLGSLGRERSALGLAVNGSVRDGSPGTGSWQEGGEHAGSSGSWAADVEEEGALLSDGGEDGDGDEEYGPRPDPEERAAGRAAEYDGQADTSSGSNRQPTASDADDNEPPTGQEGYSAGREAVPDGIMSNTAPTVFAVAGAAAEMSPDAAHTSPQGEDDVPGSMSRREAGDKAQSQGEAASSIAAPSVPRKGSIALANRIVDAVAYFRGRGVAGGSAAPSASGGGGREGLRQDSGQGAVISLASRRGILRPEDGLEDSWESPPPSRSSSTSSRPPQLATSTGGSTLSTGVTGVTPTASASGATGKVSSSASQRHAFPYPYPYVPDAAGAAASAGDIPGDPAQRALALLARPDVWQAERDRLLAVRARLHSTVWREGWLIKEGHVVRNWKRRYFVLAGRTLTYYRKKPLPLALPKADSGAESESQAAVSAQGAGEAPAGVLDIRDYSLEKGITGGARASICMRLAPRHELGGEYLVCAESEADFVGWVKAISATMREWEDLSRKAAALQLAKAPSVIQ